MIATLSPRLAARPRWGNIVIPFVVDERKRPIDFKALRKAHVDSCAFSKVCGVCGQEIKAKKKERFAFLGPAREMLCFADPWMHEDCAEYTIEHCPFVSGKRRAWREGSQELLDPFEGDWMLLIARNGKAHLEADAWHFQPVDIRRREVLEQRAPEDA